MKITRVKYDVKGDKEKVGLVALCSIVLDNCLKMQSIKLCRKEDGEYYLIFPSKQDAFLELVRHNERQGKEIAIPERKSSNSKKTVYEEYFHPVTGEFYVEIKDTLVKGYEEQFI